jgi:prepilin-type processing-associated H-X9-DG protein
MDKMTQQDGTGTTLMLSENIFAGNWGGNFDTTTGVYSIPTSGLAFGLRVDTTTAVPDDIGAGGALAPLGAPRDALWLDSDGDGILDLGNSKIGMSIGAPYGTASLPRPSSLHAGGTVNVIFCDGHGQSMSPSIDNLIYAQTLSSNGVYGGQPVMDATSIVQ